MDRIMEFKLRTLVPIWTGGIERNDNSILRLTGLKGSIRWWYEVLVRGLDGYACDPTDEKERCTFDPKEFKRLTKEGKSEQETLNSLICPVCKMFGCTNWGGKFVLRIEDNNGSVISNQIKSGTPFTLKFIERKGFTDSERKLINAAMKIIVEYGAIGGKTTLKPSEVPYKNCKEYKNPRTRARGHHIDYGLIAFQPNQPKLETTCSKFVAHQTKKNKANWPDLKNFWFLKGAYIDRQEHNQLVSRNLVSGKYSNGVSDDNIFMGGFTPKDKEISESVKNAIDRREKVTERNTESKKIFSFHGLKHCNGTDCIEPDFNPRCFGYERNATELTNIATAIQTILNSKGKKYEIKTGLEVLR